ERLVNRIQGRDERVHAVLPTHLVVRNSTAIVRQAHAQHEGPPPSLASVPDGYSAPKLTPARDEPAPPS
ncbi:MAG TPA: hypothetical protein VLI90_18935, partial [Tepidisphaeraceae bacterium]|nr:hypothetical protein [Tepidisphaeraceae bacterium]